MKKILFGIISIMLSLMTVFLVSGCSEKNEDDNKHEHYYSSTYNCNTTGHWHECACGEKKDFEAHTYGEWIIIEEATEESAGRKKQVCSVCGYENIVEIPKLDHTHKYASELTSDETGHWYECTCGEKKDFEAHSYGEWIIIENATEENVGRKKQVCSICGYENIVEIPKLDHTHKFASELTYDEIGHWHSAICEHTTEKKDFEEHTYGDWVIIEEATEESVGRKKQVCSVCEYENIVEIPKLDHTHKYAAELTYDETGHWYECTCGEKKDFEAHSYGEWIIIENATEENVGRKKQVCSICGYENIVEFSLVSYTISYNLNGGENNDLNPIIFTYLDDNITLYPLNDLFGMNFEGWYTSSDFDENTKITVIDTSIEKNVNLYAKWKEYKIVEAKGFEVDNSLEIPSLYMKVDYDTTSLNLSDLIKVSDGANWIITNSLNNLTEGLNKTLNINIGNNEYYIIVTNEDYYTIYSINVYRLNKFNYQFIVDGESILGVCEIEENGMINIDLSDYTNKTGFEFNGWLIAGTDNVFAEFPFKATNDVTFVASYTPISYKIKYVLDDEYENDSRNIENYTVADSNIVLYSPKSTIGRSFLGWYTSPTFESDTKVTFIDTKNPKNYVLYPNFISYCIESAEDFTFDYENYELPALTMVAPNNKTLLTLSRSITVSDGCSWTLSKDIEGIEVIKTKNVSLNTGNNIYYITVWYNDVYNIVYILDIYRLSMFNYQFIVDGNVVIEETTVEENTLIDPDYSKYIDKIGYSFKGFTTNGEDGIVTFPYKVVENVIFEAVFSPSKYSVNYYINNELVLKDETVYKSNYTFKSGIGITPGYEAIKWVLDDIEYNANQTITYDFTKSINVIGIIAFVDSSNFEYNLVEDVVNITKYIGNESNVIIPEYIKINNQYYKVAKIGELAFSGCSSLTSIEIPSSVTSIGLSAFYGCSSLTSIVIPDCVTSIGSSAFSGCSSLESITIPFVGAKAGVTASDTYQYPFGYIFGTSSYSGGVATKQYYYGSSTSSKTSTTYYIPSTLKSVTVLGGNILYGAFYNCSSLTSIAIPDSVTSIGESAFYQCYRLVEIFNLSLIDVTIGSTDNGYIGYYAKVIHTSLDEESNIIRKDDYIFIYSNTNYYLVGYDGTDIELVLPESINDSDYIINNFAFYNCSSLTCIVIPDCVTSIGESAFSECISLTSIEIPNSVTSIGSSAFSGCSNLSSVTFAEGSQLTGLLGGVFSGCSSLTSIEIPNSVTSIVSYVFDGCRSLTNVYYDGTIEDWCNITFSNASSNPMYYASNFYILDEKLGTIEYNGKKYSIVREIEIPNTITSIGRYQFYGFSNITSIIITESVTSIGPSTFSGCSSLTSIVIPDCVTSIGESAFSGCSSLTSIVIPDCVTSIGSSAFEECRNLASVKFAEGSQLISIGEYAFHYCSNLTSIAIPSSVTSIGSSAFSRCSSLEIITIPFVGAKAGVTSSDTYQYPFGYIFGTSSYSGGVATKQYYYGLSTSSKTSTTYYIPSTLKSVTVLGGNILYGAFYNCSSLTSIAIPDSVTSIGSSTFSECSSLTSIKIPSSVTSIGSSTFSGCSSLTSIVIPDCVTSIGLSAFYGCSSLTSIEIPDSVTSIGSSAFEECRNLASVTFAEGSQITSIDTSAFWRCSSLTSIEIPDSVTSIGSSAFEECRNLASVTFAEGSQITSIGSSAFSGCSSLTSIAIPSSVTSIGLSAFSGCSSLASVKFAEGSQLTGIGGYAFFGCSSLESITIPFVGARAGVTSSDTYQFPFGYIFGTSSYEGGVATTQYYYGSKISSRTYDTYYIPKTLKSVIVLGGNILDGAFYNCSNLTSIAIPDSVTNIGSYAFYICSSLESIEIPNSVTSIGSSAFENCRNLASVTFAEGSQITSIGSSAFEECSNLASVTFAEGSQLTSIGQSAFYYCSGLTSIAIPSSVTSIGSSAFSRCSSLSSVTFAEGSQLTGLLGGVFSGCSSLTSIEIPNSVTSIVSYVFDGCRSLTNVYYNGTIKDWYNIYFDGSNSNLINATIYYYSESKPTEDGNYWHYVDGVITIW